MAALAALDAVLHRLIETERDAGRADLARGGRRASASALGDGGAGRGRARRGAASSATAARGGRAPRAGVPGPELLAEVLVLAALNEDPAATGVRELVDDQPLRDETPYEAVVDAAERQLGGRRRPERGRAAGATSAPARAARPSDRRAGPDAPLPARLREPMRSAPGLARGAAALGPRALVRDPVAATRRSPAGSTSRSTSSPRRRARSSCSGAGDALRRPDRRRDAGLPRARLGRRRRSRSDTEWMPRVVLMAKSTYVWLEQLARDATAGPCTTLADVPDEELDRLAGLGVTGLWLIGLWQRSRASAEIKRRRGDADAVASAYAIDEYRIADDLGGEAAFEDLSGARLGARHPDRRGHGPEPHGHRLALGHRAPGAVHLACPSRRSPPTRSAGPDLSPDARVEITLEDHYWDGTDAAVVFRRRDRASGEERFIYHGNDGTSFPWNDTAQLDYLSADVREAVIRTILDVARRAPILRFDAAMVLARRHIRRLWYPEPGAGGAIPSRAEHALSNAEFNRRMPAEFWREVVDRVAAEAPGTLLLAEAFWLLEGYFVRTLGMHRVYNSAFMHMLRDEDNAGYRKVMRDTLEFDPGVLGRFVNFLTNPDERPAAEQFGTGDKAFSAATLLATLPGPADARPRPGRGLPRAVRHGVPAGPLGRAGRRGARRPLRVGDRAAPPAPRAPSPARTASACTTRSTTAAASSRTSTPTRTARGADRSLVLVHHRHAETTVRIDHSIAAAAARRRRGRARASASPTPSSSRPRTTRWSGSSIRAPAGS